MHFEKRSAVKWKYLENSDCSNGRFHADEERWVNDFCLFLSSSFLVPRSSFFLKKRIVICPTAPVRLHGLSRKNNDQSRVQR